MISAHHAPACDVPGVTHHRPCAPGSVHAARLRDHAGKGVTEERGAPAGPASGSVPCAGSEGPAWRCAPARPASALGSRRRSAPGRRSGSGTGRAASACAASCPAHSTAGLSVHPHTGVKAAAQAEQHQRAQRLVLRAAQQGSACTHTQVSRQRHRQSSISVRSVLSCAQHSRAQHAPSQPEQRGQEDLQQSSVTQTADHTP